MGRRELVPYVHNGIMHKLRRSIRHFHAAHAASLKATHPELWQAEIGHLAATIFSITRNGVLGGLSAPVRRVVWRDIVHTVLRVPSGSGCLGKEGKAIARYEGDCK